MTAVKKKRKRSPPKKKKAKRPVRAKKPALRGYAAQKQRSRTRQAQQSLSGREIGEIPPPADQARRDRCKFDFRLFCETYFRERFCKPWSDDHLRVIQLIETVVLHGGQFAIAMPRGGGKTVLCECAALWAVLYGHHAFVSIIGPDQELARRRIENIKKILEHNDLIGGAIIHKDEAGVIVSIDVKGDFPKPCVPIHCLEGIHQRKLITVGRPIRLEMQSERIILADIDGSMSSGAVIVAAGLTGQIRGAAMTRSDGSVMRPTLVIIDDPQTRESAHSPSQCAMRERIVNGDVLGLAGPGERIAVLIPCTVIAPDDMADRILDRKINPQWRGVRTAMVRKWSTNEGLWHKYQQVRGEAFKQFADQPEKFHAACNAFYAEHRAEMDAGAEVSWPERMEPGDLSALQHAWNIRTDRKDPAFFAEYQNEPLPDELPDEDVVTDEQIRAKVNGVPRTLVPLACARLTMFIDIQKKALYWAVVAWQDDFTGYVIDYGTEPDQKSAYFTLREIKRTLARAMPRAGLEGAIYAGLKRLCERKLGIEWKRDDGAMMRIDRCMIDANWGESTDIVYQFCRQSDYAGVLAPGHGRFVGASSRPFSEYKKKRGDRVGLNWRQPALSGRRALRHVSYDTNYWKSFIHKRLAVAMGDPGCLSLWGKKAERHRALSEHLTAEYAVKTEGRGRTVHEWKQTPGRDNHWLDCVVGCAVAAAMQGSVLFGTDSGQNQSGRKVSFAEMVRRRKARSA